MRRAILFACMTLVALDARAEIIRFGGTIDSFTLSPTNPSYAIASTFMGTLDYDRQAVTDRWIVRSMSIYIGGNSFIRSTNELAFGSQRLNSHDLQVVDASSGGNYFFDGLPGGFLNETALRMSWAPADPSLQRNGLDFGRVTGGSIHLALNRFDPLGGISGAGIFGTITEVGVPEPGTLMLFGVGIAGLMLRRRRATPTTSYRDGNLTIQSEA